MAVTIKFDDTCTFFGFTLSYKWNDDLSKTLLIAECYRRMEMCLDSLNFHNLKKMLRSQSFVIHQSIDKIEDGDIIYISSL